MTTERGGRGGEESAAGDRTAHSGPSEPPLSPAGRRSGELLLIAVLKLHANTRALLT